MKTISIAQLDTIHYIPPTYTNSTSDDGGRYYLVLSTNETEAFTVTIENGNKSYLNTVSLSASSPKNIPLGIPQIADGSDANVIANGNLISSGALGVIGKNELCTKLADEGLVIHGSKYFFVNIRYKCGSQGTILTSKGSVGLGTDFYSGHMYSVSSGHNAYNSHFISVMATDDNTYVTFSNDNVKWNGNNNTFTSIKLDKGDCYTVGLTNYELNLQLGRTQNNKAGLSLNQVNGTRITSTKPIAVNSGSWCASSSSANARDMGFDQLVPKDVVGKEHVMVKGKGKKGSSTGDNERTIIVAGSDSTAIKLYSNSSSIPVDIMLNNAGDYYITRVEDFYLGNTNKRNLYFIADKPVYTFQTLGGSGTTIASSGFCFIPPLKCTSDPEVTIPFADNVGNYSVTPSLYVISRANAIIVNNNTYTTANPIYGKNTWNTFNITGLADGDKNTNDHWNVKSPNGEPISAALTAFNNVIGAAGFFSGFGDVPEMGGVPVIDGTGLCSQNAILNVTNARPDWNFIWYKNGEEISGANDTAYTATTPGYYKVVAVVDCDGTPTNTFPSNIIKIEPCIDFLNDSITVNENDGFTSIVIELSNTYPEDVHFDLVVSNGSAQRSIDFNQPVQLSDLVIPQGQSSLSVHVPIINDNINEPTEKFLLSISNSENANIKSGICNIYITDDNDSPSTLQASFRTASHTSFIPENIPGGKAIIDLQLDKESGYNVCFDFKLSDITAEFSEDYVFDSASGEICIATGNTSTSIEIDIIDDNIYEPGNNGTESSLLVIEEAQYAYINDTTLAINIIDDDLMPTLSINNVKSSLSVNEGDSIVLFLELSHKVDTNVSFSYRTVSASANDTLDYQGQYYNNTVALQAGDSVVRLTFSTLTDVIYEGAETFTVELNSAINTKFETAGLTCTYNATIFDENAIPNVTILDASVYEGEQVSFDINLSTPLGNDLVLQVTVTDSTTNWFNDIVVPLLAPTITIPANTVSSSYKVQLSEDVIEENVEYFKVILSYNGNSVLLHDSVAIGTVIDNDSLPLAREDIYILNEDDTLRFNPLANDELGDQPALLAMVLSTVNGQVLWDDSGQEQIYIPNINYFGNDSLTYYIKDADADISNTATVLFTVNPIDDIPIAQNDTFSMVERTHPSYNQLNGNVTSNDLSLGDGIKVELVSNVSYGTLLLNSDGSFQYNPDTNYFSSGDSDLPSPLAPDKFTYKVIDTSNTSQFSIASVEISIAFYNNEAPIANKDSISISDTSVAEIQVLNNDTDTDGNFTIDKSSLRIISSTSHGSLSVNDGVIIYAPIEGVDTAIIVKYMVNDFVIDGVSSKVSNEGEVKIKVLSSNTPPVAQCHSSVSISLDSVGLGTINPLLINNGSYDANVGDSISLSISDMANILAVQANGSIDLSCANKGTHNIQLKVLDSQGAVDYCTSQLTVVDTIKPKISYCGNDSTIYFDDDNNGSIIAYTAPIFSDNCDGANIGGNLVQGSPPGSFFNEGTHTIAYQYSDGSGNFSDTCSFKVILKKAIEVQLLSSDANDTICENESIHFNALVANGVEPFTYSFFVNNTLKQTSFSSNYIPTSITDETEVFVSVLDSEGQTTISSIIKLTVTKSSINQGVYHIPGNWAN